MLNNDESVIGDAELSKILAESNEIPLLEEESLNNPNLYISEENMVAANEELLQTEILICEKCQHPNIIGTQAFNRREKSTKHVKVDNVVDASLTHFSKINKLDLNSAMALLLFIAKNPKVSEIIRTEYLDVPKRRGQRFRSKKILSSTNA